MAVAVAAVAFLLVCALVGYASLQYHGLVSGIKKSDAAAGGAKSARGDINILVMGLDSRLDENGKALPRDMYAALHTGDEKVGGLNANVLMLLHVPGSGAKASVLAIPRDDYAALAGCPDGLCVGKIKQAYGLAVDQASRRLVHHGVTGTDLYRRARDAGRQAELDTVRRFLGVPIDHFVEVTMVAFFQIAQVVQPITVCVKENTQDSYSGARFFAGRQKINAVQAMAFVRQRRDTTNPGLNFTDLDRSRRQQAFIASLFEQLKQAGTLTNPARLSAVVDVAKQNTAVDRGLDVLALARQSVNLSGADVHFYTLPIVRFGTDPRGESVNFVNLPLIQRTVHHLLYGAGATQEPRSPHHVHSSARAVSGTGGGKSGPPPTALTDLAGGGIPCVK